MHKRLIVIALYAFVVASVFSGLASQTLLANEKGYLALDSTTRVDAAIDSFVAPYRDSILSEMNRVIGFATEPLLAFKPESPLSNVVTDMLFWAIGDSAVQSTFNGPVDFALVNIKSIRSSINKGNVRVGDIFTLLPFENKIVIVGLKGHVVNQLFQYIATQNGDGLSGASFKMQGGTASDILIGNSPIDLNKTYSLAVTDYVANGGDGYSMLAQHEWRINTPLKLRDAMLMYLKSLSLQQKPVVADAKTRIRYDNQ